MESIIKLRNGKEVVTAIYTALYASLKGLIANDPIGFYELVCLARDPNHKLFGNTSQKLKKLSLVQDNGKLIDYVALIIDACVEGEGMEMTLVSGVDEEDIPKHTSVKTADIHNYELFLLVLKIADIVLEYVSTEPASDNPKNGIWLGDQRSGSANAFYNQTADGIFLELYYGSANCLWTPWGKWNFASAGSERGGCWEKVLPEILKRFDGKIYIKHRNTEMGSYGPVYSLHSIDGVKLPDPVELDQKAYDKYDVINNAWGDLRERYRNSLSPRKSITPLGFDLQLATHLQGVPLWDNLFSQIKLSTDSEGYVQTWVIDNIKSSLKVALQKLKKEESPYTRKVRIALERLGEYGTHACNDRMVNFLEEFKQKEKEHSFHDSKEVSLMELLNNNSESDFSGLVGTMNLVVNQVKQTAE